MGKQPETGVGRVKSEKKRNGRKEGRRVEDEGGARALHC